MADEQAPPKESTPDAATKMDAAADTNSQPTDEKNQKIVKNLKSRKESAKRNRRTYYSEWKRNVELRIGHIASQYTGGVNIEDEVQTEINPDWALTKTKTANLFSQVPRVQFAHENDKYLPAIGPFSKQFNYEIGEKRMNIGVAMEECLNDVVNAAGVAAIEYSYVARFDESTAPAVDQSMLPPEMAGKLVETPVPEGVELTADLAQRMIQAGMMPMKTAPLMISDLFDGSRISPTDLLWPVEFIGSDFEKGDWIGRTGKMTWAEAKNELKLTDEQKEAVTAGNEVNNQDQLKSQPERGGLTEVRNVIYDVIYYRRHRFDADEKNLSAIWKLVFVKGIDDPVIHEAWKGQKVDEKSGKLIGSRYFPIQVLTLTYITDNPIPPSDSSASRPQVNDLRRSRSQLFQNRQRSIPLRWYDVNRIDPLIQATLMRGTVQGMIPTNGDGSRALGEIARASYPAEDLTFDTITKQDMMEMWQIGPAQMGLPTPGRKNKAEQQDISQNFATRIGQERNRVSAFFLRGCEVTAGLMALYSDFPLLSDEEKQAMEQAWDDKHMLHDLVFSIRPDSTLVLDTQSRINRLTQFLNLTVKSGFVNPKPIIIEIAELSGLDPAKVIIDPQPKPPEEPNMSYRFTGKEDLFNPVVMALLLKHKKAPSPEEINEAKKVLELASQPLQPEPPQGGPAAGAPGAPPPAPAAPAKPKPQPHPTAIANHPDWVLGGRISKRSRDIGGNT